ncbi:MAG: IS21 family transposase [Myxococcota bacterium]
MRKIREILHLRWAVGLSQRQVAASVRVSQSTVHDMCARAKSAGLSWPLPEELGDEELEQQLYRVPTPASQKARAEPDCVAIHRELRKKGLTLQLLWQEYIAQNENPLGYVQFCNRYRAFRKQAEPVMRQVHRAGEKMFVDFSGLKMPVANPETGEVRQHEVFVATLGASNNTFAHIYESQDSRSWLDGHVRAYEFFDGVPEITVPDNLKAGVTKACFYDPDINRVYLELSEHYGTVVIPTRVRKPRDKAKVENGVQQVERWCLAPLRNQVFFSAAEAQRALGERLDWLNNRPFQKLEGTRRSHYEEVDRPALKPLPRNRFELASWKADAGVDIDYHVEYESHYYSVPYTLIGKRVDVRATTRTIEIFHRNDRVALNMREYGKRRYVTSPEHRPKSHQRHAEWSPSRLIGWANTIGPATAQAVRHLLESMPHPEQGYRSVLGIMRLGKTHGQERLERASERALACKAISYRSLKSMLAAGLERAPVPKAKQLELPNHSNVRGPDYYQ